MRYKAKQLKVGTMAGQWAVFAGRSYFSGMVYPTEREAKIAALEETGRWHQQQIDKVDKALRKLGALDESDPHGYMC